jgi:cell division protein FtsB
MDQEVKVPLWLVLTVRYSIVAAVAGFASLFISLAVWLLFLNESTKSIVEHQTKLQKTIVKNQQIILENQEISKRNHELNQNMIDDLRQQRIRQDKQ